MRPIQPKTGKSKRGKKTPQEKGYISRCISFGCLLTYVKYGIQGEPAEYHHQRTGTGAGAIAGHSQGFALSPRFHRLGNEAIHVMGRKAWEKHWGVTETELVQLSQEMHGWQSSH